MYMCVIMRVGKEKEGKKMKRYSYRDSMGWNTSVEMLLMDSGDFPPTVHEAGQIFRALVADNQLMTLQQINRMLADPDERHLSFELEEYTVDKVRQAIRDYRHVRKYGGRFGSCTYRQ